MCKRVKLNSYEPFVRDKSTKFVTHSWYNNTLSFGTPFVFLKTYKIFQCWRLDAMLCHHLPFMDLLSAKEAPISGEDRGGITGIITFSLSPFTYNKT